MDYSDKIARYEEIERRGLLSQLPQEKQEAWAEYKRRQQPALQLSDEQKAQIQANNEGYAQRSEANRPWMDKNPIARLGIAALQGISNASLNPAGYVARAAGIDTKPFTPENAAERGVELAGEYGFDAAALGGAGNIAKGAGYLGKGQGLTSRVAQTLFAPENITQMAVAPATAMGLGVGIADPSTEAGKFAVGMVSGMVPAFAQGAAKNTTQSVKTGLKNILGNNKGVKAVAKGTMASEEVAKQVANEAPATYNQLNADMVQALDDAAGRKLNITNANASQQQRYNDFIRDNADVELYSPKSAQEQSAENFKRWFDGSKVVDENGKPLKLQHVTSEDFDTFDLSKAGKNTNESLNLKGIWLGDDELADTADIIFRTNINNPKQSVRRLPVYVNMRNPYRVKNLNEFFANNSTENLIKQGYDGVINTGADFGGTEYIAFNPNQIKSVNNSGAWSSSPSLSDAGWTPKAGLKQFTQGLDDFQKDALNQALSKGASMSTSAKGTLGATHRAQEVLNDMIDASYDTSIIGQRKPTTETRQLMTVKERLNQILEPSGVKPYDAGISKAKALQANFEKGYNFKPSEIKIENIGLNTLRDRKAFLQGRIQKILDNTLSDGGTNLATAIKKDENTLRKLLPASKFDNLMSKANQIETNFKRLKSLEGQANNRLVRDSQQGSSPWRENIESRGSIIGRSLDVLSGLLNRRGNTNLANQYLGNSNQVVTRGGLKGAFANAAQTGLRQALIEAMDNN